MPRHDTVTCPRCGAGFECKAGSVTICQCAGVSITPEQRDYMAQRWGGCLCVTCLREITQAPESEAPAAG